MLHVYVWLYVYIAASLLKFSNCQSLAAPEIHFLAFRIYKMHLAC